MDRGRHLFKFSLFNSIQTRMTKYCMKCVFLNDKTMEKVHNGYFRGIYTGIYQLDHKNSKVDV